MEQFKELVSLCKHSVEISVNDHRDCYETVEQWISGEEREGIDDEVFKEMVKRNTIVKVQAYPNSAIGFYVIFHYDIDKAMEEALEAVKQ